jgi:hypothetical protein
VRYVLQEMANFNFSLNTLQISYDFVRDELRRSPRKSSGGQSVRICADLFFVQVIQCWSELNFERPLAFMTEAV